MNNITCIRPLADIEQIAACKDKIEMKEDRIRETSVFLGLAGNEVRMKILYLLHSEKELCVCDLSDILNMKIPAVSQHLRKLKDGNLVDYRKEAQTYFYYVKSEYFFLLKSLFKIIDTENELHK